MKTIQTYCEEIFEDVVRIRRTIHHHPEIGMECPVTTDFICDELRKLNIPFKKTGDSGVIAEIHGSKGSSDKIVMLRADMDALCTQEKTNLPFASEIEGRMHACGHDIHTAMLLGSAHILSMIKEEYAGTVRLIFQPGEEISKGAEYMIAEGAMENVQMGLGIHVDPLSPVNTVSCKPGPDWAAVDHFLIRIHGTGAHGATPQKGSDATVAAAAMAMGLQTMVSRECDPMKPLVVTVGSMHSGHAYNIISDEATLEGTCRSFDEDVYDLIPEAMERIVKHIAEGYKCSAELELDRLSKPLINDERAYNAFKDSALKIVGTEGFKQAKQEMIGEDFAFYGHYAPCVFAHLGCDGGYPLHNNHVNFKEEAMKTGMAIEVQFVLDVLE